MTTPEDYMDVAIIARGAQGAGLTPQIFDSEQIPAAPGALADLRATIGGADLAAPPVVLPDFHHKSNMELPSSVAVATRASIRPTLTSASVNCGMALMAFDSDRPAGAGIDEFYRRVRERFPYPPGRHTELSPGDVLRCAVDGGTFAVDRFGVDPGTLERVEEFGRLNLDRWGGADRLRRELPSLVLQLARLRFGMVGPTNHFVELQQVEEVFEAETAAKLGIAPGQLTLQYHAGGGVLPGAIGAMFGRRKHHPREIRAAMAVVKPLYHGATARSLDQLRQRYRLYFSGGCPPVALESDEGQRLMLANAAAMNYGFAFRLAIYAGLRQIAADVFGGSDGALIVDSPHNSIYEEQVAGQQAVVHRHNSCRAYPAELMPAGTTFAATGQAVLVPGTHRTSSYLCVGAGSAAALHSACHGAGTVVSDFVDRGISAADPHGRGTLRFRYDGKAPTSAAQFDDAGVNEVLAVLVRGGLVRPVARMRPFAVLH
jgi:tRNA-splicing ligase RtcB (3'-phosphate/5'-hydroxy nucleic acid ligase)